MIAGGNYFFNNVLILHRRPAVRETLKELLENEPQIHEASDLRQALALSRNIPFDLIIAEAAQGDFSSLAGIIPADSALFLVSTDREALYQALATWPEDHYVEIQPLPLEEPAREIFRRRLHHACRWLALKPPFSQATRLPDQVKLRKLTAEIQEMKNFLYQKVLQELEQRLSWEIRYLLSEQEKLKIQLILKKIYAAEDVSSLLDCVHDIKEMVKAQSITFYILDETETMGKFLKPFVFEDAFLAHPDFARYNVPLEREDFAAWVALTGEELNIKNPEQDNRYSRRYREQLRHPLRNLLIVPIMHDQEVIGVIEAYNKQSREAAGADFSREDQRLLKTISEHISMAMTKLNLIQYDALTGLLRPEPFFEKILQKIHTQSKRRVDIGHCAMVMGDVDWFKNYNDRNGHEAGNRLLRELASILKSSIREEDMLCRYGGEEFLFFLLGVKNIEEACLLTDRIRRNVEEHYFEHEEHQPRKNLTMSFGVTILPRDRISPALSKEDLKKLAGEADLALAEAKGKRVAAGEAAGREEILLKNRVCAFRRKENSKTGWGVIEPFRRQEFLEKRRHVRHFISTPLLILEDGGIRVTKTINLSLSGAKISLASDLPSDRPLSLTILLEDKACQLAGGVVYKEKASDSPLLFHAGIKFHFSSPAMQKILEDYLLRLENKSTTIN